MSSNCLMCEMDDADESSVVFRDELWAAEVVPGFEVPGWFILRARRHAERITGLDASELEVFGRRTRDVVAAVAQATEAEATYILAFGENHPHFHVLITARGADVPSDRRAGDILKLRAEAADVDAAKAIVPDVRAAYEAQAAQQLSSGTATRGSDRC